MLNILSKIAKGKGVKRIIRTLGVLGIGGAEAALNVDALGTDAAFWIEVISGLTVLLPEISKTIIKIMDKYIEFRISLKELDK